MSARRQLTLLLMSAVFITLLSVGSQAQAPGLSGSDHRLGQQIAALLNTPGARQAHWGIEILSMADGKEVAGWNPDRLFVPASTAKLFTVAAALNRLGPDFRYRTTVDSRIPVDQGGTLHGDLILVGRGDPNLSGRALPYGRRTERTESPTKDYEDLAEQVVAHGVRTVEGNLIADDSYFVREPFAPGWSVDDLMWTYGAPPSALAINDNILFVNVQPRLAGELAAVNLEPKVDYYQLDDRVRTVARSRTIPGGGTTGGRELSMDRQPGSTVLHLWGQIPEGDPGIGRGIAIEDPPRFAAEFFREELARRGVEVKGSVQVRRTEPSDVTDLKGAPGVLPSTAEGKNTVTIASHESLVLAESLKVILKTSQNLHAEMLLRTLGRERRGVGSLEAGLEEVRGYLRQIGLPEQEILLRDGSGLSRETLVTPQAMAALLRHMDESEYGSLWSGLLPIAGQDGSLADRLKSRATNGRIWAKTGSLTGVAALAGYVMNQKDERFAFVLFANDFNPARIDAADVLDRIVELIARSR